jgi:hypothetical protein
VEWNWQGKTCSRATSSTTNPTWTNPGSKPSLRGERPATNSLSHGMAYDLAWLYYDYLCHASLNYFGLVVLISPQLTYFINLNPAPRSPRHTHTPLSPTHTDITNSGNLAM